MYIIGEHTESGRSASMRGTRRPRPPVLDVLAMPCNRRTTATADRLARRLRTPRRDTGTPCVRHAQHATLPVCFAARGTVRQHRHPRLGRIVDQPSNLAFITGHAPTGASASSGRRSLFGRVDAPLHYVTVTYNEQSMGPWKVTNIAAEKGFRSCDRARARRPRQSCCSRRMAI
jgi:hypothetical protein